MTSTLTTTFSSGALARGWIEAWANQDYQWLADTLSEGIVHTSPFGTLSGRDHYLSVVVPLAKKSVQELTIKRVIEEGDAAAIWFVNTTPQGPIESCDWITTKNGQITQVQSFYDTANVRQVLSEDEQSTLKD